MSPGEVRGAAPRLLTVLVGLLGGGGGVPSGGERTGEASTGEEVAGEVLAAVFRSSRSSPSEDLLAMQEVADALSSLHKDALAQLVAAAQQQQQQHHPSASSTSGSPSPSHSQLGWVCRMARHLAFTITSIAERDIKFVASSDRALSLAGLMLMCLSAAHLPGGRLIADAALDYFCIVNTVRECAWGEFPHVLLILRFLGVATQGHWEGLWPLPLILFRLSFCPLPPLSDPEDDAPPSDVRPSLLRGPPSPAPSR